MPSEAKHRCNKCKCKTGLFGIKCKCGLIFCMQHRYSDQHNCMYDYLSEQQQYIQQSNPVIVNEKVTKF